ncbi:hypothetical protein GCM10010201_30470 [Pilimelia columellifera subsp. columellifera]|uniref:Uncharacterized protein n=1 Tax=Pilimelia columellifera subsp. columellifera TaxID=706583 RepID=A0ABP6B2L9_9ACTN
MDAADPDAGPGDAWTRWLVWLGDAEPPGPPSHLRFGPLRTAEPGVLVSLSTGVRLTARRGPGGPVVVVGPGVRWHEQQIHTGERWPDPTLRLAGLVAEPHHRQSVDPAGPGGVTVALVRPAEARR